MITKETARQIYNCYLQLENITHLREEMIKEVEKVRKEEQEYLENNAGTSKPIPENESTFGKFGKGMQLGVPDDYGRCASMRLFNISPEVCISVMEAHEKDIKRRLEVLESIAKLELHG